RFQGLLSGSKLRSGGSEAAQGLRPRPLLEEVISFLVIGLRRTNLFVREYQRDGHRIGLRSREFFLLFAHLSAVFIELLPFILDISVERSEHVQNRRAFRGGLARTFAVRTAGPGRAGWTDQGGGKGLMMHTSEYKFHIFPGKNLLLRVLPSVEEAVELL